MNSAGPTDTAAVDFNNWRQTCGNGYCYGYGCDGECEGDGDGGDCPSCNKLKRRESKTAEPIPMSVNTVTLRDTLLQSSALDTFRFENDILHRNTAARPSNEKHTLLSQQSMWLNNKFGHVLRERSIVVDILAIFFGIGTWIGINGTFIQLPLLVKEAPESWSLPSYLAVVVQIGNIGPVTYTITNRFVKNINIDAYAIYSLLGLGTISALLTAFFYNVTAQVFGTEHSLALFILTFFTAITACTSSVLFMPYMGRFKEIYLITYFIGEGLSGMLPSVVALIQGIGDETQCILTNTTDDGQAIYEQYTPPPRFDTMSFFLFIFVMMLCSCVGFTLLDRLKYAKRQYADVQVSAGNEYVYKRKSNPVQTDLDVKAQEGDDDLLPEISSSQYFSLLTLIGVVCFFSNGMLNSIQSYSCLPYGYRAYHLSATLSVMANPVACLLAVFLPHTSVRSIWALSAVASILTAYVFTTAVMSPTPFLQGTAAGSALVITVWTLLIGIVSYVKLSISSVMRSQGGKSLVWTGCLSQVGSAIGAVIIFVLINCTNSFQSAENSGC